MLAYSRSVTDSGPRGLNRSPNSNPSAELSGGTSTELSLQVGISPRDLVMVRQYRRSFVPRKVKDVRVFVRNSHGSSAELQNPPT